MAKKNINVGNVINDGTGDDIRTAFVKVNNNFTELYDIGAQNNTGANVGSGSGIFKDKTGDILNFKSLTAGNGIRINPGTNNIVIESAWPSISSITADDTHQIISTGSQAIVVTGAGGISTSISGNTLTIRGGANLVNDSNPTLSANPNLAGHNLTNGGTITANSFVGALTGTVNGIDVTALNAEINSFDFGSIISTSSPQSLLQWLKTQFDFDLGTITSPAPISVNLSSFV
jgi:hypothetical protein